MASNTTPPDGETLTVWTVGHSNQSVESFLRLLTDAGIDTLADVRTEPVSRYLPQFNQRDLQEALESAGIRYVFFGDSLGGRPPETRYYDEAGHVLYDRMAESERFQNGVEKLLRGARRGLRIAMMCSEEDPLVCHRHLLIGRVLEKRHGVLTRHLRADGATQSTEDAEGPPPLQNSLFDDTDEKGAQHAGSRNHPGLWFGSQGPNQPPRRTHPDNTGLPMPSLNRRKNYQIKPKGV
ncbi:MAG: DUF488 domain-containing protein [Fibrella sp.]|nr:DUF488 domain-containing protein [Armatimonadota bacterium]